MRPLRSAAQFTFSTKFPKKRKQHKGGGGGGNDPLKPTTSQLLQKKVHQMKVVKISRPSIKMVGKRKAFHYRNDQVLLVFFKMKGIIRYHLVTKMVEMLLKNKQDGIATIEFPLCITPLFVRIVFPP